MLYCFVDTNIFMQFEMFDQVDWPSILEADEVCLVIPKTVIQELDKFKDDPRSERRRRRARKVLPKIRALANPNQDVLFRDGSYLRVLMTNPLRDWLLENGYDPDDSDDRVVGAAQFFQEENPELSVVILAHDTGVQLKAMMVDIEDRIPPESIKLPDEPDPVQKENQELRRKAMRLENAQPDLKIGFSQNNEIVNPITFAIAFDQERLSPEDIRLLVEEERMKREGGGVASAMTFSYVSSNYLKKYRQFLIDSQEFSTKKSRTTSLIVGLENIGAAPASDIDIELCFPDGIQPNDIPPDLWLEPEPPVFVSGLFPDEIFNFYSDGVYIPSLSGVVQPSPQYGPVIDEADSQKVQLGLTKLKHNDRAIWDSLYITFDVPSQLPPVFPISYRIIADNIPDPIEGNLVIRLAKTADG
ncbi:MAG: hypothetical protein JXA10_02185 [Anaerolineae bacterium]|nr:hypothetical protein [Anaerolineae bacterium]